MVWRWREAAPTASRLPATDADAQTRTPEPRTSSPGGPNFYAGGAANNPSIGHAPRTANSGDLNLPGEPPFIELFWFGKRALTLPKV